MTGWIPTSLLMLAIGGAVACSGSAPPRDLTLIRVGMTEAQVRDLWGMPLHMYKLEESRKGCVERHDFGILLFPGALPRPANVDFDAQHRVCAVGAVDIKHSKAPPLATEMAPPPPPTEGATPRDDIVFMKNGGRLRGTVMEESPEGASIQLSDGTLHKVMRRDIDRIEYAK